MTEIWHEEMRLCDDDGMVSHQFISPDSRKPRLTYYQLLNNLRRVSGHKPYEGEPFACTGSAHLAGMHIRCTSPVHMGDPKGLELLEDALRTGGPITIGEDLYQGKITKEPKDESMNKEMLECLIRLTARRMVAGWGEGNRSYLYGFVYAYLVDEFGSATITALYNDGYLKRNETARRLQEAQYLNLTERAVERALLALPLVNAPELES